MWVSCNDGIANGPLQQVYQLQPVLYSSTASDASLNIINTVRKWFLNSQNAIFTVLNILFKINFMQPAFQLDNKEIRSQIC
jgi:hypothetical protein